MKLWDKGIAVDKEIEAYTVGNDPAMDLVLLPYDIQASIAHARMLVSSGFLTKEESKKLVQGLQEILALHKQGKFVITTADEDGHTAIEKYLTEKYGEVGKKIHTARSRNDQSLVMVRLYMKEQLGETATLVQQLCTALIHFAKKNKGVPMPGYTHMQRAMPSSVSLWTSAYVDALTDDLSQIKQTMTLIDQNPLGSAAGYGVPVTIDRGLTTKELGFAKIQENPIYCGMSRGKFEANVLNTLSQVMADLNKLATDLILFSTKEFGFFVLPANYCTGSSIMPQKKNPDVLELMRANYHVVVGYEIQVKGIIGNVMSGYQRDLQLTKEPVIRGFTLVLSSLSIAAKVVQGLGVQEKHLKEAMSAELYATEKAYALVKKGMSFREAYKEVGKEFK
ncbi:argininosuccinate lyase [Candidatus Woesearchaeota archaeon]|nr:argininosuccinate lyase [Candidatus Woesearchaeota archaeon]